MRRKRSRYVTLLLGVTLLADALPYSAARAQARQRCFPEIGLCIERRIGEFWEQNGELPAFGLPITSQPT